MNIFFEHIVRFVLKNKYIVLAFAVILFGFGTLKTINTPVDILPDLNRPMVTIFTEAEGFAAEEVELLITTPIESVMNGATGVERVRSISAMGLSLVFVDFDWGQDIYIARQIVSEKLAGIELPEGKSSVMGPISSVMGEIEILGLSSPSGALSRGELRTLAEWTIRPKLLTVEGVSQVTLIGGDFQEYQIIVSPEKLTAAGLTISEVVEKLEGIVENKSGNFLVTEKIEYPIRIIGKPDSIEILENVSISTKEGEILFLKDIAEVVLTGRPNARGDASMNAQSAVLMSITKQPGQNTLDITERIAEALEVIRPSLGDDIELKTLFAQDKFIKNGISNVASATRDAAILVLVILLLFLGNFRATFISLVALPFSFIIAILILLWIGIEINVMTLGGLAVAIGELTDDAVISVENAIRWLKANTKKANPLSSFEVIVRASSEVRGSVIFSTLLVVLMFLPLFSLGGIEGKLLAPLGLAYIVALLASTFVAMTITAVLCLLLLPDGEFLEKDDYTPVSKKIKQIASPVITWSIRNGKTGLLLAFCAIVGTGYLISSAGKEFLPPFNEGTLTINMSLPPGYSLQKSNEIGTNLEKTLLSVEGVKSVGRRSGRAEEDEHANGVNISELEVDITTAIDKNIIIADIQKKLGLLDLQGANISIGQPISHRIEHILSGVRAPLVIKIFGPDLEILRTQANQLRDILDTIPGTLKPVVQQEVLVPQIVIEPNRDAISKAGFSFNEFTEELETILSGQNIGSIVQGTRSYNLQIRMDVDAVSDINKIRSLLITAPNESIISLSSLAEITIQDGQNSISHDNGQRRIVVSSGILDGDSVTIIETLQDRVKAEMSLPQGYFLSYEGTYKSQKESSQRIIFFSIIAFIAILVILYLKLRSFSFVFQVLINVPVTFLGGLVAVYLTGNVINLASLVGLISLLGLSARNGILLIEHWMYLIEEEKKPFSTETIVSGSLNRLIPMLITSLTSMLALLPLILGGNMPGKEMLYPLSAVVFGGLLVSTFVEIVIRPGLFMLMGKKHFLDTKTGEAGKIR